MKDWASTKPSYHWMAELIAGVFCLIALMSPALAQSVQPNSSLTVSGKGLFLDGRPFQVHGVQIDALNAPAVWFESGRGGRGFPAFLRAYNHFATDAASELSYAHDEYGANTIEFAVSQRGLDSEDPYFSDSEHRSYVSNIKSAVALARGMGFVVILTDFNSRLAGGTTRRLNYPDDATLRVNVMLARMFGADGAVMLEVYNEPWPPDGGAPLAAIWEHYIGAGPGRDGHPEVGINSIIQAMRVAGARNVIIIQPFFPVGWRDYPGTIVDDGGPIAFGVHPYMKFTGVTRAEWDAYFGDFARSHATVVTEWHENAGPLGPLRYDWCIGPDALQLPREKLHYFDAVGVNGVVGWALDVPGTLLHKFEGVPTKMTECGLPGNDVGEWLKDYFAGALP